MTAEKKDLVQFFEEKKQKYGKSVFDKNNKATIKGTLMEDFTFSHQARGINFYKNIVRVQRSRENFDNIPVVVSEEMLNSNLKVAGKIVEIIGCFRSKNFQDEKGKHTKLYLLARKIIIHNEAKEISGDNYIFLDGYICKEVIYSKTSQGVEKAEVILVVNRKIGKCDYIPCIAWCEKAREISLLKVGSHIQLYGRIHSKQYEKQIKGSTNKETETKEVYEVLVSNYKVVE